MLHEWMARAPLCSFVPEVGWNDCMLLPADQSETTLWQYGDPGRPVELWIVPGGDRPPVFIGEISAAIWQAAADDATSGAVVSVAEILGG